MRPEDLLTVEKFWRDHYEWLQRLGYTLRPRYNPEWVPSWYGTNKSWLHCEDGIAVSTGAVIDAVRSKDDRVVMIKHLRKSAHPNESIIGRYLSSPPLSDDPRNHSCPVLDVFDDPGDPNIQYIVMPLLRNYKDPKFTTVGEAVEFFRQAFEGLQFMHEHHVAHRDISILNIMMDSAPILPNMFHPQQPWRTRDNMRELRPYTRTARPVKYYFTDFGLSSQYNANVNNPVEIPILGGDKTVPEFQKDRATPRNPFHTDVYYMGNLVRRDFLQQYSNFAFMEPLIARMVQDDPDKRPTIDEALSELNSIVPRLSKLKLRERLVLRRDGTTMNLLKGVHQSLFRTIPNLLAFRSALPTPKA